MLDTYFFLQGPQRFFNTRCVQKVTSTFLISSSGNTDETMFGLDVNRGYTTRSGQDPQKKESDPDFIDRDPMDHVSSNHKKGSNHGSQIRISDPCFSPILQNC